MKQHGVGATPKPNQVSQFVFQGIFQRLKANQTKLKTTPTFVKPVEIWLQDFSRAGNVTFMFNQKLKIPEFLQPPGSSVHLNASRSLVPDQTVAKLEMHQVNFARDIMDLVIFASDKDLRTFMNFTVDLVDWTEDQLVINLNFSKPELVSKIDKDFIIANVLHPEMFTSKESNVALNSSLTKIINMIPRQLPRGIDEESVKTIGSTSEKIVLAIAIIQIAIQYFLKGALDRLWQMYFTMQMLSYMTFYDTPLPALAEFGLELTTSMVEFKSLKLENLISTIDPSFSLYSLMIGSGRN